MPNPMIRFITEVTSIKMVSRMTGWFARSPFSKPIIPFFAKIYNINITEAELPLNEYRTLNQFFTRKLKQGARKLYLNEHNIISPVDARITAIGSITNQTVLTVKGQNYTVSEILNQHRLSPVFQDGKFIVLYLSPTDYHRIHAPASGDWISHEHTRGAVLPVHDPALTHVPGVLRRNERLTTYLQHSNGKIAVIKVGAMNVASIQYACPVGGHVTQGQELAYFEFGSTVVLFIESNANQTFEWNNDLIEGNKVKLGQELGLWTSK